MVVMECYSSNIKYFGFLCYRFNFSVGQHEIELVRSGGCKAAAMPKDSEVLSKLPEPWFVLPTGLIEAKNNEGSTIWSKKVCNKHREVECSIFKIIVVFYRGAFRSSSDHSICCTLSSQFSSESVTTSCIIFESVSYVLSVYIHHMTIWL